MAAFLRYVRPGNVGKTSDYAASDQLDRVAGGDELWTVTSVRQRLFLRGHLHVGRIVARRKAEMLLGRTDLWEAKWYAIAQDETIEPAKNIDVTELAEDLRFDGGVPRLPDHWTPQSLQTMRKLTVVSAGLLREAWLLPASQARRNPKWQRDELILALDLYVRLHRVVPDDTHPEVIGLSKLLNNLPIHAERPDATRFRNPNGVALKLANFRALDQPGHGMARGGRTDKEVWEEFAGDATRLSKVAAMIREGANAEDLQPSAALAALEEDEGMPEGRLLQRMHTVRERNPALRKRKKAAVLRAGGKLACEVCGFEFGVVYGEIGDGFIECHHTVPISTL